MSLRMPFAPVLLAAGILLAALAPGATGAPPGTGAYILGPGDTIQILVVGYNDLSQTVTIKPDGAVDLPLVGEVTAAGKTPSQLAAGLVDRYSEYLKAPLITVEVRQFRMERISILGQVSHPGEYQIRPGGGILELLASAGGPTARADLAKTTIIRGAAEPIELNLLQALARNKNPDVALLPGDVVFVPAADRRIVVLGQVTHPGAYDLLEGQRVADLLAAAGGVTPRAALRRAFLVRGDAQIPIDVQEILAGDVEANVPLKAGDMVVVPESRDQIAVLGAVSKPGKYDLADGMTLTDAIALAGGQSESGNLDQVAVVRIEAGKTTTTAVNLRRALSGQDPSQNIPLRPGDVVYVPERGVTLAKAFQFFSIVSVIRLLFGAGTLF